MPTTAVPPKDLVFKAKMKVGIAAIMAGWPSAKWRGVPVVMSSGTKSALNMETGIKSNQSISHLGSRRLARKKSGIQRGKKVTAPIPINKKRYAFPSTLLALPGLPSNEKADGGRQHRSKHNVKVPWY
jgi:hypothetical protein